MILPLGTKGKEWVNLNQHCLSLRSRTVSVSRMWRQVSRASLQVSSVWSPLVSSWKNNLLTLSVDERWNLLLVYCRIYCIFWFTIQNMGTHWPTGTNALKCIKFVTALLYTKLGGISHEPKIGNVWLRLNPYGWHLRSRTMPDQGCKDQLVNLIKNNCCSRKSTTPPSP